MNTITKTYAPPQINRREILRYFGCYKDENKNLLDDALKEIGNTLSFKVCFAVLPIKINTDCCDFEYFKITSKNLAKSLENCQKAVVFGATIGIEIDRLINRYSIISPTKALLFQAIGAERIESLCNTFCEDIKNELNSKTTPRFSPGYGDLPLDTQKDIFKLLNLSKNIGLTLNDSMLMSPTKSVTAFVGLI